MREYNSVINYTIIEIYEKYRMFYCYDKFNHYDGYYILECTSDIWNKVSFKILCTLENLDEELPNFLEYNEDEYFLYSLNWEYNIPIDLVYEFQKYCNSNSFYTECDIEHTFNY